MVADTLIQFLAGWALRELWLNDKSILASSKAAAETMEGFLGRLLNCPFCLAYHAPFWWPGSLLMLSRLPAMQAADLVPTLIILILTSLSATALILFVDGLQGRDALP